MVQWARYTLFTTVTGQQVLNKTCLKCWGPLRKERLKSSEGDKEDSRQHIHSPLSSAQKVSACAVVFSRLISSSFSVEEQEEYIRPPPPPPPPRPSSGLLGSYLACSPWIVWTKLLPDPSLISCHMMKSSYQGPEKHMYQYICRRVGGKTLSTQYFLPSFSLLICFLC